MTSPTGRRTRKRVTTVEFLAELAETFRGIAKYAGHPDHDVAELFAGSERDTARRLMRAVAMLKARAK